MQASEASARLKIANAPPVKGSLIALIGAPAAALLITTVAGWEGKRNDPYKDIVGVWTVCYGDTKVAMRRYSDAECSAVLSDRLVAYAGPVLDRNPELAGHAEQLAAASSLAYNIGPSAYARSSVARTSRPGAGARRATASSPGRWLAASGSGAC